MQEQGFELMLTPVDYLEQTTAEALTEEFDGMIYYANNTNSNYDLLFELASQGFLSSHLIKHCMSSHSQLFWQTTLKEDS